MRVLPREMKRKHRNELVYDGGHAYGGHAYGGHVYGGHVVVEKVVGAGTQCKLTSFAINHDIKVPVAAERRIV